MLRPIGFWLGLFACFALPGFARAQDPDDPETGLGASSMGGLQVTLTINKEPYRGIIPLGKRACDENYLLEFEILGFSTGFMSQRYIEIWRGNGCANGTNRNTTATDDACVLIDTVDREESSTEQVVPVMMQDLCEQDGTVTLYFLPVDTMNTNEDVSPYGSYPIEIDRSPPSPPSAVDSKAGETEIPIDWEPGSGNVIKNWIVWDTMPVDGSEGTEADGGTEGSQEPCSSGWLTAGEDFDIDDRPSTIRRREVADVSSYKLDGSALGAKRVALGIIAEDEAGNRSVLSNITCVTVVPTDGFWDAYLEEGGDIEPGCACSLPGTSPRRGLPLLLIPAALAIAALRLRRKRRS